MSTVDQLKANGNAAFASGDHGKAIDLYGQAIQADASGTGPSSHILFSNRAASFLARNQPGDAVQALADASAAIRLNASFAKAYTRKGQALMLLKQYQEAYSAFQGGLKSDPANASLREGMEQAQQAMQKERMGGGIKAEPKKEERTTSASSSSGAVPSVQAARPAGAGAGSGSSSTAAEEDPMAAFLAEISGIAKEKEEKQKEIANTHAPIIKEGAESGENGGDRKPVSAQSLFERIIGGHSTDIVRDKWAEDEAEANNDEKSAGERAAAIAAVSSGKEYELSGEAAKIQSAEIASADLGSPEAQAERILGPHRKWLNLNPFEVLQLPHSCLEDDLKVRYRKLSALVHPDKNPHPQAGDAFQEVKKAYDVLLEANRRRISAGLTHNTIKEIHKQRRKAAQKLAAQTQATVAAGKLSAAAAALQLQAVQAASQPNTAHDPSNSVGKGLAYPDEETAVEVRKAFAEVEHRKRMYETRVKAQADREAAQAVEEHERQVEQAKADQEWAKNREARKANWEQFDANMQKKRKIGEDGAAAAGAGQVGDALKYGAAVAGGGTGGSSATAAVAGAGAGGIAGAAGGGGMLLPPDDYKKRWR